MPQEGVPRQLQLGIVLRWEEFGVEPVSLVEFLHGGFVFALPGQYDSKIVMRLSKIGLQADRLAIAPASRERTATARNEYNRAVVAP